MYLDVSRLLSNSIIISTEHHRFLFNVPEGTQRFCSEHAVRLAKKCNHIFLTSVDISTTSGLPGLVLTLSDASNTGLYIHGPLATTSAFINATRHFVSRPDFFVKVESSTVFSNDEITIKSISLVNKKRKSTSSDNKSESVCYIITSPELPQKFDVAKAKALGIKPGPEYGKLAKGLEITTMDNRVITPSMVMTSSTIRDKQSLVVLAIPSMEHLECFLENGYNMITNSSKPSLIVHLTPPQVYNSKEYSEFINTIETSNHWYLSSYDEILGSNNDTTVASNTLCNTLATTYPLNFSTILPPPPLHRTSKYYPPFLQKHVLVPVKQRCFVESLNSNSNDGTSSKRIELEFEEYRATFLGTGSAIPSKYRNVSSTLLSLKNCNILLDAGESTASQLSKLFPTSSRIDIIYISHHHADHHMGILSIIKECTNPIKIIGPTSVGDFLSEYFTNVASLSYEKSLVYEFIPITTDVVDVFGIKFDSVAVDHCKDSYGVVILTASKKKYVYSGDCRPSTELVRRGMDATLLIHEATFEDDMMDEAVRKKHSTVSEAISVGTKMKAKTIVLNHFSQRYPKTVETMTGSSNVMTAFDLMTIRDGNIVNVVIPE